MPAACPFPTHQGTQVLIHQLADALAGRGHAVTLTSFGIGAGDLEAFDAAQRYTISRAPRVPGHRSLRAGPSLARPVADASMVLHTLRVARAGDFDLIHAHNYEGALVGAIVSALTGLPTLYHAHCMMGDELPTYTEDARLEGALEAFGRFLDRSVPPLADAIVSVSPHATAFLRRTTRAEVFYLPPAIDYGPPVAPLPAKAAADIIYTGNLDGYQRPDLLFGALRAVAARRPALRFTLVTPDVESRYGPWLDRFGLRARTVVIPHADFGETRRHLEAATLTLLPRTIASGFPIKLINALYAGCPTVACRSSAQGLTEADGVITVDDDDLEALTNEALALLEDPARRATLSLGARAASRRFGWGAALDTLDDVYTQLAPDRR